MAYRTAAARKAASTAEARDSLHCDELAKGAANPRGDRYATNRPRQEKRL